DSRPTVLCDCPFFPEFQALFDEKVRCVFATDVLGKGVDALTHADMAAFAAAAEGEPGGRGAVAAVVSHQHAPWGAEALGRLPSLRVVSNHGVGHGYTPGAASAPTGELGAGLILASARRTSSRPSGGPATPRQPPSTRTGTGGASQVRR
ncbi:unnamed protein product, partial [Prorocentrum cordatum]